MEVPDLSVFPRIHPASGRMVYSLVLDKYKWLIEVD